MAFLAAFCGSSAVMACWLLGWETGQHLFDGLPSMKFNTALALALLAYQGIHETSPHESQGTRFCLWGALALAISSLLQVWGGVNLGLETLVVDDPRSVQWGIAPGVMSPGTALAIAFLALGSLFCQGLLEQIGTSLLYCSATIAALAILLYLAGVHPYGEADLFSSTAVHTAQLIALLVGGFLILKKIKRRNHGYSAELWRAQIRDSQPRCGAMGATLVVGLALSAALSFHAQQSNRRRDLIRYHHLTSRLRSDVLNELAKPVHTLELIRRFFASSDFVSSRDFANFAEGLDTEMSLPGAKGIGFIELVAADDLPESLRAEPHEGSVPTDPSVPSVDFRVKYAFPPSPNRSELRPEMWTDPLLHHALARVVATGQTLLSERVQLGWLDGEKIGHLLAVPVFKEPHQNRRPSHPASLEGILYMPLVLDAMFTDVARTASHYLDFRIYDTGPESKEKLIFCSSLARSRNASGAGVSIPVSLADSFSSEIPVNFGGRNWTIQVRTNVRFAAESDRATPVLFNLGGNLLTLLIAGLVWSMTRGRERAVAYADAMTAELQHSEAQALAAARNAELAKHEAQQYSSQLQMVIEGARDHAIVTLDTRGRISSWNDGAQRIFGFQMEEILGSDFACLYPQEAVDEDLPRKELNHARYADNNEVEGWRQCKNGSLFWANVVLAQLRDADGKMCGFSMIVRNQTEKRRSEVLINASVESAPLAMVMVNSWGKIVLVNREAENLFGYQRAELLGESIEILLPQRSREEHPKYVAEFFAAPQSRQMGAGRDLHGLRKDGTEVPVEIGLKPVETEEGLFILAAILDITERKRAEAKANSLAQIIKESPNEIYILDQESLHFMEVNEGACQATGYSRAELLQMTPLHLAPSFGLEMLRDALVPLAEDVVSMVELQTMQRRKNGDHYPIQVKLHKSYYQDRAVYVMFINDLTAVKELESRLSQAQKLESIGQLAAGVAHEINTPMQFVNSNVEFLQEMTPRVFQIIDQVREMLADEELPGAAEERLQAFENLLHRSRYEYCREQTPAAIEESIEGVQRVVNIVRAMKLFSHPGSREKSSANINDLVASATIVSKNRWKYAAEMDLDLDPSDPWIECFPAELNQVLLNLIVNAADAITENREAEAPLGRIMLRTRKAKDLLVIECEDTGGGIPDKIRHKVFDSFFTTKDVGKGTGQGLAISYDIVVNKHGGKIEFESVDGVGTTFRVTLPVAGDPLTDPDEEPETESACIT